MKLFSRKTRSLCIAGAVVALLAPSLLLNAKPADAQAVGKGITNLELPRFVSLTARRANMRVGPGKTYSVS